MFPSRMHLNVVKRGMTVLDLRLSLTKRPLYLEKRECAGGGGENGDEEERRS